jgi:hypothetical protein
MLGGECFELARRRSEISGQRSMDVDYRTMSKTERTPPCCHWVHRITRPQSRQSDVEEGTRRPTSDLTSDFLPVIREEVLIR